MVRLGGMPPPGGGVMSNSDFYSVSKSSAFPTYHPTAQRIPGQSQYASPEAEAQARPYADIGKIQGSMFPAPQTMPTPGGVPATPGAEQIMREGLGLNLPGQNFLGGGIDFLSHIAQSATQSQPGMASRALFERLKTTPDDQLTDTERQVKSLNSGLFARSPDSPMMEGQQISEMYKAFQIADAHNKGQSSIIQTQSLGDGLDLTPVGGALRGYALLSGLFRRAIGGGVVDQLKVLQDTPEDQLGEERLAIKKAWQKGDLNDAEARDSIAMSSFATTNPNPIKLDDRLGPVDTMANMAISFASEFVTDPLSIPMTALTFGGWTARAPLATTLTSITRSVERAVGEAGAKTAARAGGKAVVGAVDQDVMQQITKEAARIAGERAAREAPLRRLPKEATIAAKQLGTTEGAGAVKDIDLLDAFLEMGADRSHPWAEAIRQGIEDAGIHGQIAVKAPRVIKMAEAIDKLTDPFSLYGYWRTGRVVPVTASKLASHGYLDALGWRVIRGLDSAYREAGVNQDVADAGRQIAGANHVVQAGDRANTARAVGVNSALHAGESPTDAALRHASRRPGDIRRLTRDQVDKTLEFIVPSVKGGKAEKLAEWRARAAKQLTDMGADPERARAVAGKMEERAMRALANDHWGHMIDVFDKAKRSARATAKWDMAGIGRMAFMGPRQMADQDATAVLQAVAEGKIDVVRTAVRRFRDLNEHISESLPDDELMQQVERVTNQIKGALPTRVEDTTDLPPELANFVTDYPGYSIMLRPDDQNLLVPVRDAMGNVTGAHTWLDNITARTPKVEVTQFKSVREGLLRGVSGGEIERNVARRFATNMADYEGFSESESASLLRSLREAADITGGGTRGLQSDQIIAAVDKAVGLSFVRKEVAKRSVIDAMFDAYENEARLVGVLPKLTGWVKKEASGIGGNALGWLTDNIYGKVRFQNSPIFFLQEVPEAPFWLALQGRYPMVMAIPGRVTGALEAVPGPTRAVGRRVREAKAEVGVWNAKTMTVMDRLTKTSPNSQYDMYEAAELVRMGLAQAAQMTEPRTALGKLIKKLGMGSSLSMRKQRNVAIAARAEFGETWKRSLQENAPEQWLAVRSFYPDHYTDGEVAIQWALDMMARGDPDSIYATLSPNMFNPSHIGRRAEVSDRLIRHFVYGADDADNHTWAGLVQDIKDKTVSVDQVRRDLEQAGADPDYVERAITRLTFGTPEEFYQSAVDLGVTPETVKRWGIVNREFADKAGITEGEYLARTYAGKPLSTDQMGNIVGDTLFDDVVANMKARGKAIPDSNSQEVADLKRVSNDFITDVMRPVTAEGTELAPIPRAMPRGTPESVREAANKVRGMEHARADREANPLLAAPPSKNIDVQVEPARFGLDARGNATVPEQFKSEPGFVYRTVNQSRIGSDWRVGEYAAKHPATIYADNQNSVVLRVKQNVTGWTDAVGGVGAHENVQSMTTVPASAVEILGADGRWRPAQAPTQFPEPLYQTNLHTIGITTPEQYRRQIMAMMDPEEMSKRGMTAMSEKDVKQAIEWYDHMRRATFALVDDNLTGDERIMEAARILIAFGTTQLNTSPADGYRHVFKAYGMKARGEELQLGEARNILQQAVGLNPEQLHNLVWGKGNKVSSFGLGQKLFDFIDSLTGSKKRTIGILGPNGNWGPVAVDVHTKRDFGYLDPAMGSWVYRLIEKPDGVRGTASKFVKEGGAPGAEYGHFVVEMSDGSTEVIPRARIGGGVPTDHEYDYGVELANDIRDHFNETNFMNREWSSYEVQALGWYRMQLLKSSEGDAGEVGNALFEQSRWMGSNDLVPSVNAPMNEVHPFDAVLPEHHRFITTEGARHASDEAEQMSGARVLTKMDAPSVVNGAHRDATTVELMTDPTGAEQYLAHYLYLAEQDSGVLMRDYVGKTSTPNYAKGVGISVDIPMENEEVARDALSRLAAEGGPLQAIGPHTFIARASDGSLHLRTLWEPGAGKADRNAFKKALTASGLNEPGQKDTLVDFISLKHDWKADPTGKTYTDVIERGSGKHGVMRSPEQRAALVAEYDAAYQSALASGDKKAIAVAKKEMEVARAAPSGRSVEEVRQLVRESRLRVRTEVTANFDKVAAREVRHERERVLGEARDAAGSARLGTDPTVESVLDLARASNGERLYDRTPGGTVRAAITRASTADRRAQLYFNRSAVTDRSLIHELVHLEAHGYDDSAVRTIKGVFKGLEGTPYGQHMPGSQLTEAEHEFLVSQYFLWADNEGSVHPAMAPLLKHLHGQFGSHVSLRSQATGPAREAIRQIDADIGRLQSRRAVLKQPAAIKRIDDQITALKTQRAAASAQAKALRAGGGLHPDIKAIFDEQAAKAGTRTETRASTYNSDEADMLEWAQIAMSSASRRANDLVHMRGERSALERSINHPFLGIYPYSYTYGKVLPYLTEFMMARPFGIKAPFLAYTMGQSMNQSFNRQQQYDPELRKFLYKNEPFLRAMSMFVPGVPWDLPANSPVWMRRIMENWMTNAVRHMHHQKPLPLDIPAIIADSAQYQLTLRGTDALTPIARSIPRAADIFGGALSGDTPPPKVQPPPQR